MPTSTLLTRLTLAAVVTAAAACTAKTDQPPAASADSAGAPATTTAGTPPADPAPAGTTGRMAGMTGNADQDFLRMMSDHHKGLVAMAHLSVEGKKLGSASVQADARKMDKAQDAELDSMVTMLEQQFRDPYAPKVMPDNQAMIEQLSTLTGAAFDRQFYANVVKHHQEALRMIDEFMSKLQRADVKAMAQRMRADQAREITAFQRKAAHG